MNHIIPECPEYRINLGENPAELSTREKFNIWLNDHPTTGKIIEVSAIIFIVLAGAAATGAVIYGLTLLPMFYPILLGIFPVPATAMVVGSLAIASTRRQINPQCFFKAEQVRWISILSFRCKEKIKRMENEPEVETAIRSWMKEVRSFNRQFYEHETKSIIRLELEHFEQACPLAANVMHRIEAKRNPHSQFEKHRQDLAAIEQIESEAARQIQQIRANEANRATAWKSKLHLVQKVIKDIDENEQNQLDKFKLASHLDNLMDEGIIQEGDPILADLRNEDALNNAEDDRQQIQEIRAEASRRRDLLAPKLREYQEQIERIQREATDQIDNIECAKVHDLAPLRENVRIYRLNND